MVYPGSQYAEAKLAEYAALGMHDAATRRGDLDAVRSATRRLEDAQKRRAYACTEINQLPGPVAMAV